MRTTTWFPWYYDKSIPAIRRYRYIEGQKKWDKSVKTVLWKHMDVADRDAFIRRLNATLEAKKKDAAKRFEYDHAYINTLVLERFEAKLTLEINQRSHIKTVMATLRLYTLKYFIHTAKVPDPNQWKRHESGFGTWLLSRKISAEYVNRIVQNANRFLQFLHDSYFDEVRLIKLKVIGKHLRLEAPAKMGFIRPDDFDQICKTVDQRLLPLVKLAYCYGLRRSETLALTPDCIYEDYLHTFQQVRTIKPLVVEPTKTRDNRKTPHWYISAEEVFELIENIEMLNPSTVSHLFRKAMKQLNMRFTFHDLRRTFITNAALKYHYREVMHASGHKQIATHERYVQDHRQHSSRKFVPKVKLKAVK